LTGSRPASNIPVRRGEVKTQMEPDDEYFMRLALIEAKAALKEGEVPVGAVVVIGGRMTSRGHNSVIAINDPTAHAEVVALRLAGTSVANYRLSGATLYSTIEPCAMCAGALIHARVERLVYGARDPRAGAVDTHLGICATDFLNHRVKVESGVLEADCRAMIQCFFRRKRNGD
jgi:tRNA(adenine34) deaminase